MDNRGALLSAMHHGLAPDAVKGLMNGQFFDERSLQKNKHVTFENCENLDYPVIIV